jgi:hypothetical protein
MTWHIALLTMGLLKSLSFMAHCDMLRGFRIHAESDQTAINYIEKVTPRARGLIRDYPGLSWQDFLDDRT